MDGYILEVNEPIKLLKAIIDMFYGNAYISMEGRLKANDFSFINGISKEPTEILKRNTIEPRQDFIIFPLEADTKEIIKQKVLSQIGLRKNIDHILVQKDGKLVFAAYDNFDSECVWIMEEVTEKWLEELHQQDILKSFKKEKEKN
jgi:hypothetical protein